MKNDIKYCLWDVGQTIYPYSLEPLDRWARSHTLRPEKYNDTHNIHMFDYKPYMQGKINFDTFCQDICLQYDIQYDTSIKPQINKALHQGIGPIYQDTVDIMHQLKSAKITNCILSNALPILSHTVPLEDLISAEHRFTSYELGYLKPSPEIFEATRAKLSCNFSQIMLVDDKAENISAASKLGIVGILCRHDKAPIDLQQIISPLISKQNTR